MTTVQLTIYAILLVIIVCCLAGLMEIYKKSIRKGKASRWENYIIAALLVGASLWLLIESNAFQPLLGMIGAKIWMDYSAYILCMYILQYNADRKIIKKVIRSFVTNFLKKAGMTDEQAKDILAAKDSNKELSKK